MFTSKVWVWTWRTVNKEKVPSVLNRSCSDLSIVKTHLEVPTFCDIHVDVPCKVRIRPLNVHKYHNLNAFLLQTDQKYDNAIEHYVDGNKVIVKGDKNLHPNTLCSIKAPVKANIDVKAGNDVSIGFFHGDKVKINTEGNIFVDRFQGDVVDVSTKGNIILNNSIQASSILATAYNGSIRTGRLQALNLKLKTINKGDISVDSSYCSESIFVVENGNMNLNNIHKNCKIFLVKGNLVLTGFDGELSAIINSGSADIHLSRIIANSDITLKDNGKLNLKFTDSCQDYTKFKVVCPNVTLSENIKSDISKIENAVVLQPTEGQFDASVLINCQNAALESTTWHEMVQMKLKNK
ncbi:uncharacterized protein LOC115891372 [Sitophilus oryzae]|uniref:Uncharacterized protein LOC115891372 n=1 Tax=Sitophilus oryzae TaxID=7048 RepID=A0A6J2YWR1_SITOR|nr:uncharacterized protein LOC115891372 [Sitophilus oryzae]